MQKLQPLHKRFRGSPVQLPSPLSSTRVMAGISVATQTTSSNAAWIFSNPLEVVVLSTGMIAEPCSDCSLQLDLFGNPLALPSESKKSKPRSSSSPRPKPSKQQELQFPEPKKLRSRRWKPAPTSRWKMNHGIPFSTAWKNCELLPERLRAVARRWLLKYQHSAILVDDEL